MRILQKYHKQQLPKELMKRLNKVNDDLELKLNLKKVDDLLKISIYETGLANKHFFEEQFEQIRKANFELWENLSFTERNFIIKCDIASEKVKRLSFKFNDTNITIPFFDVLMNGLYDRETAILELPQFFKLYKDFHSKLIPIETYGLEPYINNLAYAKHVVHTQSKVVLFDRDNCIYYLFKDNEWFDYPILNKPYTAETINVLGKALLESNDVFIDAAIVQKALHEKCIKKIGKYRKKGKVF